MFVNKNGLLLPMSTNRSTVAKIGALAVWAHNGIVCMSKELPDGKEDFTQMSVAQAVDRCTAIDDELKNLRKNYPKSDNIPLYEKFLQAMNEVVLRAREQGAPEDKSAVRDRIRRRKTQVPVTGTIFIPGTDKVD